MTGLSIENLTACYGEFQALKPISLSIPEGGVVSIIGPNGAGKSTLLKALAGWVRPASGSITFHGRDLTGTAAPDFVRSGIALVPEGRRLFPSLSVEENLRMGECADRKGPWTLARIYDLFPVLHEKRRSPGTALSGGQQQMVAIGRSLMTNPRLLLCDEISLGLAPIVVGEIYEMLARLKAEGLSLVIVEQDVARALAASSYSYCLLEGAIRLEGRPQDLSRSMITAAYFGGHA